MPVMIQFVSVMDGWTKTNFHSILHASTHFLVISSSNHPFPFASLKVPVLDLYGELDYPAVHRLAPERLQLINHGGNPLSKQVVATGADHYFSENSELLTKEVSDWLDSLGP